MVKKCYSACTVYSKSKIALISRNFFLTTFFFFFWEKKLPGTMAHLVVLLSTQLHKFVQETILSNNQGIQGMWLPKYQYCRHRDRALKRNKALMDERVPWEIFGQNVTRSHTLCAKRDRRAFYRLILFTQQSKRHIARVISHRTLTHVNKARRPGKRNDNRCDDDLLSLTKLSRRYLRVILIVQKFYFF